VYSSLPRCCSKLAYVDHDFLRALDHDARSVQRKIFQRTDRVKNVDFHPTEPWLLAGLYNGTVQIYHVDTGAVLKTFEVSEVPVRCARFVARKQWFVAGSDDFQLRVFNYNTHEKVAAFEAHPDYIRCMTVHPTQSMVFTGSDDMTIKAWDWDKSWKCVQVRSSARYRCVLP
jgi:coatomer subunit beta'